MPRARYIYVVSDSLGPLCGFTVKKELVEFLKNLDDAPNDWLDGDRYTVVRVSDGSATSFKRIEVDELIGGEANG